MISNPFTSFTLFYIVLSMSPNICLFALSHNSSADMPQHSAGEMGRHLVSNETVYTFSICQVQSTQDLNHLGNFPGSGIRNKQVSDIESGDRKSVV